MWSTAATKLGTTNNAKLLMDIPDLDACLVAHQIRVMCLGVPIGPVGDRAHAEKQGRRQGYTL